MESFFGNFLAQIKVLVTNDTACLVLYAAMQFTLLGLAVLYNVSIDAGGNYTLVHSLAGSDLYYNVNELYVKVTKDANWSASDGRARTQEVYTNVQGQEVLKRTFNKNSSGNIEILSTYYVYDDFGNLCYTLPPGALPDNAVNISGNVITQDILDKLCYQYRYDAKGRPIAIKKPGIDWQYSVYNSLNQVVAIQDGNDRLRKEWFVTKYDGLGRVIIKGVWNNNNTAISRNDLQTLVDQQAKLWEEKTTTGNGYTTVSWPQTITRYNLINYYDDYTIPGIPSGYAYQSYAGNPAGSSKQTYDKLTATKTWLPNGTTELWSVLFYDENGRVIQSQLGHHLAGKDIVDTEYLFTGQVSKVARTHSSSVGSLVIANRYEYDHHGREINLYSKIGADAEVLLRQTVYNELGQVIDVRLHQKSGTTSFLQSLDYRYNESGSLISINDPDLLVTSVSNDGDSNSGPDLFGLKLSYHDDPVAPQYNGNIAAMRWKTSQVPTVQTVAPPKMGYQYRYDVLDRLTSAISEKNGVVDNSHNETVTYDRDGNIITLKRNAFTSGAVQEIDNLAYTYDGYRTKKIDDLSTAANKTLGYDDKQKVAEEHLYDLNGNMITDLNKGTTIIYNERNLVQQITFGTNHKLEFLYDRTGRKLQSKYTKDAAVYTIDYIGGIQYEQGQIAFIQTDEGRARKTGTSYSYEYDITDHLGNARVTFTADLTNPNQPVAKVIQQNSYYPYGLAMYGDAVNNLHLSYVSGEKSKYLYSGKELYDQGGLNWYDHGARMYDPALGRWSVTDPASQFVNPYLAMGNNPVIGVDPNGKFWHIVIGAAIGGTFNLVDKIVHGQITDFGSGLKAFGVGAFAGGLGAATGGAAIAGMSVTSVSTAFIGGSIGAVYNDMALGLGNMIAFGDPYDPSPARLGTTALIGGVTGGLFQGISNSAAGRNFWTGKFTNLKGWVQPIEPTPYGVKNDNGKIVPFDDGVTPADPIAGNYITNSKNTPYPKVVVEGYGEVPFPEGPYTPNNSSVLRGSFTAKYKADFKEWWISQGRPWPQVPEGSTLNIHHIKPLAQGGTNAFDNLVPLVQPEQHQPFTNWWRGFKQ
ncbi:MULTISPECIES: RHS repeat-associated core domain-containing protein [Sphingobacterium]|nr:MULTISPECIES: RHS repeat-associated core domain-containing protein [Sphingobacterium]